MRSDGSARAAGGRAFVFAACVACTLWLVVQNAMLLTLLPWERWTAVLPGGSALRAIAVWSVGGALIALALSLVFGLGWLASRRTGGALAPGERIHE